MAEEVPWEEFPNEIPAGWQIDAQYGAEVFNDRPDDHGNSVPGGISSWRENADISEADHAGDAGTGVVSRWSAAFAGEKGEREEEKGMGR